MGNPTPVHGKRSTYVHHRCRCELCRGAQRDYMRERYRRLAERSWTTGTAHSDG